MKTFRRPSSARARILAAAMPAALLVLGRLRGVERPAFAALLPSLRSGGRGGGCLLLDAGANTRCRPSQLAQFAVMGDVYARRVMKVASPRVAHHYNILRRLRREHENNIDYAQGSVLKSVEMLEWLPIEFDWEIKEERKEPPHEESNTNRVKKEEQIEWSGKSVDTGWKRKIGLDPGIDPHRAGGRG